VQVLGAGRALDGEEVRPEEIAAAVNEVVTDQAYAAAAGQLASAIAARPGGALATALLERLAAEQSPFRA
jgi:UDP:flavonoid glycosyltransferase YjiC (YdhE family)